MGRMGDEMCEAASGDFVVDVVEVGMYGEMLAHGLQMFAALCDSEVLMSSESCTIIWTPGLIVFFAYGHPPQPSLTGALSRGHGILPFLQRPEMVPWHEHWHWQMKRICTDSLMEIWENVARIRASPASP